MPVRNQNWYNLQETRRYPLDENATGVSDAGVKIHDGILVDINVKWPRTAGDYAFVGGLTVTGTLVTILVLGADSPTAAANFTPLAAITLPKPLELYRPYELEAMQPGVAGWVVFGDGVTEDTSLRFSTPAQGLLMPRVARPYRPLPVRSLGKEFRDVALTGVVTLAGTGDVEVVKEEVEIEGSDRDALVVRLVQNFATTNPLAEYIGPCGARPESLNCQKAGIESINGVTPDCDGNIDIEIRGVSTYVFSPCQGMALDLDLALDEACTEPLIAQEFVDLCAPKLESQSSLSFSSSGVSEAPDEGSVSSEESIGCRPLPFIDHFDNGVSDLWQPQTGTWVEQSFDSPTESEGLSTSYSSVSSSSSLSSSSVSSSSSASFVIVNEAGYSIVISGVDNAYVATSGGVQNVSTIPDCTGDTLERQCTTDLQMTNINVPINGGIVLNYRLVTTPFNHFEYYLAWIDGDNNKLVVSRWTGTTFINEAAVPLPNPIVTGDWYRLVASTTAGPGAGEVTITVTASGSTDLGWPTVSFSVAVSDYLPSSGSVGLGTINAYTRFSFFEVKEL